MAKKIIVVLVIVAVAIIGTFVVNGFVLQWFEGKTIHNGYLLPLVDSALYSIWFLVVASGATLILQSRPLLALIAAAVGVFGYLVVSGGVWVNPGLSLTQKAISYLQAHVASFMVFPAFLFVGYVAQRAAPRRSRQRNAANGGL